MTGKAPRKKISAGLKQARDVGRVEYARTRASRRRDTRARDEKTWWEKTLPLWTFLLSLTQAVTMGAWTVYTYLRPPNPIVETDRPRYLPPPTEPQYSGDRPPKVVEPDSGPRIRLIIGNIPQTDLPKYVLRVLQAASYAEQTGMGSASLENAVFDALERAMMIDSRFSKRLVWRDWNTLEVAAATYPSIIGTEAAVFQTNPSATYKVFQNFKPTPKDPKS